MSFLNNSINDLVVGGEEGELYVQSEDPYCWHNRWSDAGLRARKIELIDELREILPPRRALPLRVVAPT